MGRVSLSAPYTRASYTRDHAEPLISLPSVGRSATHALVQAQLICSGARQGMHAFIVPIRSLQDHTPLPGKPMWLPGPLPGRDTTRPPYPEAAEVIGEAGTCRPWVGRSPVGQTCANWLGELEQHSTSAQSIAKQV